MIEQVDIKNFRCFESLSVRDCRRVNVILGDNGSGKTALLEAIFLALGTSPELGTRFRQQRGLDAGFSGSLSAVEKSMFGDLFYQSDMGREISISLNGNGPTCRNVTVVRSQEPIFIPIAHGGASEFVESVNPDSPLSLKFIWQPPAGSQKEVKVQLVLGQPVVFAGTGEDFESAYFFPASQNVSALENATRFSELSKVGKVSSFINVFRKAFGYIEDLSIEVAGAGPVIHASVKGTKTKLPITHISGAVNRFVSVMLAFATSPQGVVLADEMENGVYYKHQEAMWRATLAFVRDFDCQLFTTTHSTEWLKAMINAADTQLEDISVWRIERESKTGKPTIHQFSGRDIKIGLEYGSEVRGSTKL